MSRFTGATGSGCDWWLEAYLSDGCGIVIRGITIVVAVFGLVEFMRSVIPYVHRLVQ
jgi:hypothetical protein